MARVLGAGVLCTVIATLTKIRLWPQSTQSAPANRTGFLAALAFPGRSLRLGATSKPERSERIHRVL